MKMKNNYSSPSLEVKKFLIEDIIMSTVPSEGLNNKGDIAVGENSQIGEDIMPPRKVMQ